MPRPHKRALDKKYTLSASMKFSEIDFLQRMADEDQKPLGELARELITDGLQYRELMQRTHLELLIIDLTEASEEEKIKALKRIAGSIRACRQMGRNLAQVKPILQR